MSAKLCALRFGGGGLRLVCGNRLVVDVVHDEVHSCEQWRKGWVRIVSWNEVYYGTVLTPIREELGGKEGKEGGALARSVSLYILKYSVKPSFSWR